MLKQILLILGKIFLLWIFFSLLFFYAGKYIPFGPEQTFLTAPFSVLFFLSLASFLTAFFIIHGQPLLAQQHRLRGMLLVLSFFFGTAMFAFVRGGGSSHSIIYITVTANLLLFANLLGTWIAGPLKRPAELIPLCLVMALSDIFSVAAGPTEKFAETIAQYYRSGMKGPAPVIDFILFKIPVPGAEKMVPLFGLADWVIIAFLAACAAKFGFHDNLAGKGLGEMAEKKRPVFYFPASLAGLIFGIFLAWYSGVFLPALQLVVIFFLAYIIPKYAQIRKITASDLKLMLGTLLIMGTLLAIRFILL